MSYYLTLKRPCSRCTRVEEATVSLEEAAKAVNTPDPAPCVSASFTPNALLAVPERFEMQQLCATCSGIVRRYLELAFRRIDKVSAVRTGAKPDEVLEVEAE